MSYKEDSGGNHIKALADKTAEREIENVMYYPRRGGASDLRVTNAARLALIHKHADYQQSNAGNSGEEDLPGVAVEEARHDKADRVESLYEGELPFSRAVFGEEQTSYQICKVEESTADRTYEQEIYNEHRSAGTLHQKEGLVGFALKRRDDNDHSNDSKGLRYNIGNALNSK